MCIRDSIKTKGNIGLCFSRKMDYVKAIPLLEEVVKLSTNKLGPTHEHTMRWMNHLTTTYRRNGNHYKAIPVLKKSFGFKR